MKPVVPRARAVEDIEGAVDHLLQEAGEEVALAFIEGWRMRRHPYVVFYLEREDHVDVWRVLRDRRDIPPRLV